MTSTTSSVMTFETPSHPQTSQSKRLQTAYRVLDSYKELSVDALLAPLDESFSHQILPSSLNMPARSKADFGAHASGITSIFNSFEMVPRSVYEDPALNTVVAYCDMVGDLKGFEGAEKDWRNECVIMMEMSEDGERVVKHREFVDSAKARLLREKLMEKMEREKKEGVNALDG